MCFELDEKDVDAMLAQAKMDEEAEKKGFKKKKSEKKRRKDNERRWRCRKAAKATP